MGKDRQPILSWYEKIKKVFFFFVVVAFVLIFFFFLKKVCTEKKTPSFFRGALWNWRGGHKKSVMRDFDFIGACLFTLELVAPFFFYLLCPSLVLYFILPVWKRSFILQVGVVVPRFLQIFFHRLVVYSLLGITVRRNYDYHAIITCSSSRAALWTKPLCQRLLLFLNKKKKKRKQ